MVASLIETLLTVSAPVVGVLLDIRIVVVGVSPTATPPKSKVDGEIDATGKFRLLR